MDIIFREERKQDYFFDILPKDWVNEIRPFWKEYKDKTKIYVLDKGNKIIGGGMIFSTVSPDMKNNTSKAKYWLDKGYLYLAFFYIKKEYRGNRLGDFWLKNILEMDKNKKYWLCIEDPGLENFYKRNGFRLVEKISTENSKDWIFISV